MRPSEIKTLLDRYHYIIDRLSKAPLNCPELAEEMGCTSRTVSRYIRIMKREGYQVEYVAKVRGYQIRKRPA
jgi:biotin operon repressor